MAANISRKRKHSEGEEARSSRFLAGALEDAARPSRLTPVQNVDTDSESYGNAIQQFRNISVNGWARVHMGNVYAETVNYYPYRQLPPQIGELPQALRFKAFVHALSYHNMRNEITGIEARYDGPGDWLLSKPSELEWLVSTARDSRSRSLWIRGRPGSGKSVLLKRISDAATNRISDYVVVSFFFSKSDVSLESSVGEMYRALLHQLLEKIPMLRSLLQFPPSPTKSRFLAVGILKHLIRDAVLQLRGQRLMFIIDALDECDDAGSRDVMRFFADLRTLAKAWNVSFHTCFSSRHYPDNTTHLLHQAALNETSQPEDDWEDVEDSSRIVSRGTHRAGPQNTEPRNPRECLWVQVLVQILRESLDPQSTLLQLGAFNRTMAWNHPVVLRGNLCEERSQQLSLPVIYCGFLRETSILQDLLSSMHSKTSVSNSSEESD